MDFIKKSLTVNSPLKKGTAEFGVDGDIIVPDVLPDILKIIQVDGVAVVTDRDFVGGKLVCRGRIDLKILYVPEDEGSSVKSIITSFDYSHNLAGVDVGERGYADICVDVLKVDFQLINSRKLRVKSVVELGYGFMAPEIVEIAVDSDEKNALEVKREKVWVYNFVGFKDTQFLVRESLEIPAGQSSVEDLLKVDSSVYEVEHRVMAGRLVIKGICGVCALYTDSAGYVRYSDFEMPFTEIVELEAASENSVCDIDCCIKELNYRVECDSDGDMRIIVTDVIVGAKINVYEKNEIDYIQDCFCPGKKLELETSYKSIDCIIGEGSVTAGIREVIVPDKNSPSLSGVYNLVVKPIIENAKSEKGRVCVEGKLVCYCLYVCAGDEIPVYNTMREIRFCENVEIENCEPGCECGVKAVVTHKNYALNSAGETEIKVALNIDVAVTKQKSIPIINGFEICEKTGENKKGIVVFFADSGDSLWNVAKKYAVPASAIAELNNMENDEVCDGMKLLIPSV